MREKTSHRRDSANALIFFVLALALSWAAWIAAIVLDFQWGEGPGNALVAIGAAGPALAAVFVLFTREDRKHRHDYWHRLVAARNIQPQWYAAMFLLPAAVVVLAIAAAVLSGRQQEGFQLEESLRGNIFAFLPFAVIVMFAGPLPEELGWRGYGLNALLRRFNPVAASLIVAAFWAAWHVPLFFIGEYPLSKYSDDPLWLASFFAQFIPLSILFTWLFIGTAHRTISAIFFHFSVNLFGMMLVMEPTTDAIVTVIYFLIAGWLIAKKGTSLGAPRQS